MGGAAPPALAPLTDALSGDLDPSWSPDGTQVAFSSLRTGDRNIWVARADLTGAAPLTSGTAIDERPAYSPDGRDIAFVSDRGGHRGVWLVSAAGGRPRLLAATDVVGGLSWSRDGGRLVCAVAAGDAPGLVMISLDSGTPQPLPVGGQPATTPAWSPRDDAIAYIETIPGTGAFLRVVTPDGRAVAPALPERPPLFSDPPRPFSARILAWAPDGRRRSGLAAGLVACVALDRRPGARGFVPTDSRAARGDPRAGPGVDAGRFGADRRGRRANGGHRARREAAIGRGKEKDSFRSSARLVPCSRPP